MAKKGEQIRRLKTDIERYAAACRQAAGQIRRIVDTLPQDRYKGQLEMLRIVAESLDAQAVDVTIEGRLGSLERLGHVGALGRSRVAEAAAILAAVAASTSAAFDVAAHFEDANVAIEQVDNYSIQIVGEAEESLQDRKWNELRSWDEQMEDFREREGIVSQDTLRDQARNPPTAEAEPSEAGQSADAIEVGSVGPVESLTDDERRRVAEEYIDEHGIEAFVEPEDNTTSVPGVEN